MKPKTTPKKKPKLLELKLELNTINLFRHLFMSEFHIYVDL